VIPWLQTLLCWMDARLPSVRCGFFCLVECYLQFIVSNFFQGFNWTPFPDAKFAHGQFVMCSNCFLGHFSSRKCSCKTSAVYSASWCIHIHCFFSLPWRNSICLLYCASLFLMSGITWNLCKFSHRIWNGIHMFIHYHQSFFFKT